MRDAGGQEMRYIVMLYRESVVCNGVYITDMISQDKIIKFF